MTQDNANVFSLGISAETAAQLKFGFAVERESVQEAITTEAKIRKVDPLLVYAEGLALEAFKARYDRWEAKKEKVYNQAVKVMVAGGMNFNDARIALKLPPVSN